MAMCEQPPSQNAQQRWSNLIKFLMHKSMNYPINMFTMCVWLELKWENLDQISHLHTHGQFPVLIVLSFL